MIDFPSNRNGGSSFVFVSEDSGIRHEFHFGIVRYGKGHEPAGGHKPIVIKVGNGLSPANMSRCVSEALANKVGF